MRTKVIAFLFTVAALLAAVAGALWLLGWGIQGHYHVLAVWPAGFVPTVAAGFIMCCFAAMILVVLAGILAALYVAYIWFEDVTA